MTCCGKVICSGCSHAPVYDNQGNVVAEKTCAFCRVPTATSNEELLERTKKRGEAGDLISIYSLGGYYADGKYGLSQDLAKAVELWHRAGELGYASAYRSIGYAYDFGRGVEVDSKKAMYYYELGAMGGDVPARANLGIKEQQAGNFDRALKHHMIAVESGNSQSLDMIKRLYLEGHATKEDYTKALRSYQDYLSEIKSPQRDKAAATYENCRYY